MSKREDILRSAIECVTKDRNNEHGSPEDTFQTIADLWTIYLHGRLKLGESESISPDEVARMMILLKIARSIYNPLNEDNDIDTAGYASCAAELAYRHYLGGAVENTYPESIEPGDNSQK